MTPREEKEKGIQSGKEVKLSLSADDMVLYIENPKHVTRKLLELSNELGDVAEYKINTQKSLAFLYTNNEITEREIKETITFTITSKRIQYLLINLFKEAKDLYSENYKKLMIETEHDTDRQKDIPYIPYSCSRRINILPKAIYKSNAIPINLPMTFLI